MDRRHVLHHVSLKDMIDQSEWPKYLGLLFEFMSAKAVSYCVHSYPQVPESVCAEAGSGILAYSFRRNENPVIPVCQNFAILVDFFVIDISASGQDIKILFLNKV